MRNTGIGSSLGLIAVGAILAWAVTFEVEAINVNTVGLILFGVGIMGLVVTLFATASSQKTVIEQRSHEVVATPTSPQAQPAQGQPVQAQPSVSQETTSGSLQ